MSAHQFIIDNKGDLYFTQENAQMHGAPPFTPVIMANPVNLAANELRDVCEFARNHMHDSSYVEEIHRRLNAALDLAGGVK